MKSLTSSARRAAWLALAGALALAGCQKSQPAANVATNAAATNAAPATAPATTADAADVTAFLQGLYDHYKTSKNNTFQMFDANAHEVFDDSFIRLMAADTKALKGDLGVIDGDWLCACQDFESLRATITVQSASPTAAKATSDFTDVGIPGQTTQHASISLIRERGRWRIDDIKDGDEPWLRAQLQDEIKQLKSPGAKGKSNPDEAP
jgi:hypothetical protein